MASRITNSDLDRLVRTLNQLTGNKTEPYTNGKANGGTYFIDGAYGGVKLVKMETETGGVSTVSLDGYGTKRQLYTYLIGLIDGIRGRV